MTDTNDPAKPAESGPRRTPVLTPPARAETPAPKAGRYAVLLLAGCGLLLVALALLVLIFPMTRDHADTPGLVTAVQTSLPPTPAGSQPPQREELAGAARSEGLIGDWLRLQARAEAENVSNWGEAAYNQALTGAEECDRLFREQDYLAAEGACTAAIATLDQLLSGKQALLAQALEAGQQDLSRGDPIAAAAAFQKALAIEAGNAQALAGQARAAQLPQVLRHIEQGLLLETAGDRNGALQEFASAVRLDPDFAPAREHHDRIRTLIAEGEFRTAMSRALQAMQTGQLTDAAKALARARALRPQDPAVVDLGRQIATRQRAGQLEALRRQADMLASEERWSDALQTCTKAMGLDDKAAFARACQEQARQRVELDRRLQGFLDQPERLFDKARLEEARQLHVHAAGITPSGERLHSQLARLDGLIAEASAEVTVLIKSDGQTDISLYHVGRLGRFEEKRLILRTGDYTATGSRPGYRDLRHVLKIRPGQGALVFTLVCEEPI